uniref:RNA-guided endonuclease InsQ/TnpB family protein n=1 Tax=Okeania sp. SIO2F4 TaxID=2607790 RepID=UPI0025D98536|nr:transposase [Okeania sp. SIO2F4]
MNLGEAFKSFFQGLGKHPRFKKKGKHDSFTIDNCGKPIELNGWNHKLPFIGWIKTYEPIEATTKKITISRQAGNWYLSYSYEFTQYPTEKTTEVVGVDLGVKTLATLSTGVVFPGAVSYKKFENKLSNLQYLNRNKIIGSANWKKAQLQIAKLHTKVANIRKDVLHKLTTYLAKNHSIVSIEV